MFKFSFDLSFWLLLLPISFKCFLLTSSFFQTEGNIYIYIEREKKSCKEGKELTFKLPLCPLIFSSCFYPFVSNVFSRHLLLFKHKTQRKTQRKKYHKKEKNVEKGRSLPFLFRFCIWEEAFLLLSPLHILWMLSSPPSSSLVFTSPWSFVLLKLRGSPELWRWSEEEMRWGR